MSLLDITEYKMHVSYNDIIKATEPWGTVEAILISPGVSKLNHLFIVRFKKPITITGNLGKGIRTDLRGGLNDTPFFLRGMHRGGLATYNIILSPTKMAFDINNLTMDPDDQSNGKPHTEKAAKLLKWITASGEAFQKRGISITSFIDRFKGPSIREIPTKDIVSNYEENNWTLCYNLSL